jgi:hypothetical protein
LELVLLYIQLEIILNKRVGDFMKKNIMILRKKKRKVNTKAYIITSIVLFSILVGVFIAFKRFYVKS